MAESAGAGASDVGGGGVAYVGVGSNIDPEVNVPRALWDLGQKLRVVGISTFYRTPPIGARGDEDFYNGVVGVEASTGPDDIRRILGEVEAARGRRRSRDRSAPRVIDLDLLMVDGAASNQGVPLHRDVETRRFVALPLLELAPDLRLPDGRPLAEVAGLFEGPAGAALPEFTARLRKTLVLAEKD